MRFHTSLPIQLRTRRKRQPRIPGDENTTARPIRLRTIRLGAGTPNVH